MTKTQFMQKRGVQKCGIFAWLLWCFYRSWDKSKNRCPFGNRALSKSMYHQNLKSTLPVTLCFWGPDDASHWEMCNFRMGMGSCYMPTQRNQFPDVMDARSRLLFRRSWEHRMEDADKWIMHLSSRRPCIMRLVHIKVLSQAEPSWANYEQVTCHIRAPGGAEINDVIQQADSCWLWN